MNDINSQYFSKKQIESGELQNFLNYLMAEAYGAGESYNDIHIVPADCEAFIVEWAQVPWSHQYGGRFVYMNEDQHLVTEFQLPDGSYINLEDDEEFKDYLCEWLQDNPGWGKTSWGTWTNTIENEKFQKEYQNTEK